MGRAPSRPIYSTPSVLRQYFLPPSGTGERRKPPTHRAAHGPRPWLGMISRERTGDIHPRPFDARKTSEAALHVPFNLHFLSLISTGREGAWLPGVHGNDANSLGLGTPLSGLWPQLSHGPGHIPTHGAKVGRLTAGAHEPLKFLSYLHTTHESNRQDAPLRSLFATCPGVADT